MENGSYNKRSPPINQDIFIGGPFYFYHLIYPTLNTRNERRIQTIRRNVNSEPFFSQYPITQCTAKLLNNSTTRYPTRPPIFIVQQVNTHSPCRRSMNKFSVFKVHTNVTYTFSRFSFAKENQITLF